MRKTPKEYAIKKAIEAKEFRELMEQVKASFIGESECVVL